MSLIIKVFFAFAYSLSSPPERTVRYLGTFLPDVLFGGFPAVLCALSAFAVNCPSSFFCAICVFLPDALFGGPARRVVWRACPTRCLAGSWQAFYLFTFRVFCVFLWLIIFLSLIESLFPFAYFAVHILFVVVLPYTDQAECGKCRDVTPLILFLCMTVVY